MVQSAQAEPIAIRENIGDIKYEILLPEGFDENDDETKYPLILALHGKEGQIEWIIDYWYSSPATNKGYIVVCPHLTYIDVLHGENFKKMNKLLKHLRKKYNVDKKQRYLTGMSAGADTALFYAIQYPKTFNSIALVGLGINEDAFYNPYYRRGNIKNLSVFLLYGQEDEYVPPESFNKLLEELKEEGAEVEYEIMEGGHDYEMPQVMKTLEYFEKYRENTR